MLDRPFLVTCLMLAVVVTAWNVASTGTAQSNARVSELDEAPAAPKGFPTLAYRRWSGDINVPDPVAISVANNGDVYVTQTQRRKIQDLDIRPNPDWVADDVALTSVDQKRDFYHRVLAVGGDQQEQAKHVQDVNQDGQHDYRDLTVISERIHKLSDSNRDGTADKISLFAEGFQTEVTGIAAGVMHHQGEVFATIAPDVWALTDTDDDGSADQRKMIATGFGLHIAYAGHDMHGLSVGPDGKIYWSVGDKGINVKTPDGKRISYPNQGGVMRCNPDGSDFEVFAHGLRNVQEPAFDQYGNLFGVDNDADQSREKERFVWIVDQMDAGWRCNYQYRGRDYNPWTDEKLWQLPGDEHPAYLVPPIAHYYDGPAGFKFNPGTALSEQYRNFFFLTGAPNGNQYAFQTEPVSDTFRMTKSHMIGSGDPIVGIAFAPDGGLYGVDWAGGYPLNQKGSVIRIDVADSDLSNQQRIDRTSTKRWLQTPAQDIDDATLAKLLSHADQRVRQLAQFELVARKRTETFRQNLNDPSASELARLHCIWGLGQLVRSGDADVASLDSGLTDPSWRVVSQAVKTLGESGKGNADAMIPLLDHNHAHVRVHAALALGRVPSSAAVKKLAEMATRLKPSEHYLRHAIVTALATCATPAQIHELAQDKKATARICAVLALRRLSDPSVASYLNDSSDWVATEASRAIHDDRSIESAMGSLARSLDTRTARPPSMMMRAINANFRLGDREHADRLMDFVTDETREPALRSNACQAIGDWNDPPRLDRVDGRHRIGVADRAIDLKRAGGVFSSLVRDADGDLRTEAVKAARRLKVKLEPSALTAIANDTSAPTPLRVEAIRSLSSVDNGSVSLLRRLANDDASSVAIAAITCLVRDAPDAVFPVLQESLDSDRLELRQAAIEGLASLGNESADRELIDLAKQMISGDLSAGLRLDVWNALEERSNHSELLADLLKQVRNRTRKDDSQSDQMLAFSFSAEGGDAKRGENIFRTDLRAQCVRCHRIGKKGSNIGPELSRIAKQRDTAHLLRAVVYPSADIEPKYNTQSILLIDGSVIQGVIQSEDDETTVVMMQDGKVQKIPTDDVELIADKKVSLMPDMTGVLKPKEVRDLVAFLKTLR